MTDENPYLALLKQERPRGNWLDILSNALLGAGSGLSQAGASGQSGWAGLGPGLMMGNQMTAQAEHSAEQERLRRAQFGLQAQEWDEKRKVREQQQAAMDRWQKLMTGGGAPDQGTTTPGITAPQASPVKMGPDLVAAGTPVVNYLTAQHGFSPLAAATVAGNLYQESGFNPGASGDGGTAFGMGQWRLDRQDKLKAFAASQQKPVTDPQVQLDYLVTEMKGGDMGAQRAYAQLQQAKTPQEANAAMMHFFRPQGYTPANPTGGHGFQNRVQYTQALLPNGQPVPQGVSGPQGSPAGPPPSPPPQYASLPPFEGPGMEGTIQPGATGWPQLAAPPRPQVAQGDNVTASGAAIDPNAQPPPFMQPGGQPPIPGGPNAVPVQYNPTPGMPTAPPRSPAGVPPMQPPEVPMPRPQDLPASYRQYLASLPVTTPHEAMTETTKAMTQYRQQLQEQANKQWEKQWSEYAHSRGLTEEQAKEQRAQAAAAAVRKEERQFDQKAMVNNKTGDVVMVSKDNWGSPDYSPLEKQKEARETERLKLEQQKAEQDAAQVAVDPKTMRPNQPAIDAAAAKAAAEAEAKQRIEMQGAPAIQFAKDEAKRFSETVQPGAEAAANGLTNLYEMKRLTEGNMATGPGIEGRMFTARLLDTLGIKDMPQGMVNTTEYLNRASKGVISVLQTGALGKTQISEGDRKFVEQMAAKDVGFTKQELQKLVDVAIDASHKTLDQHGKSVDRIGKLLGDKVAKDYFKVDRQTFEEWKKDNPAPGNTGAPGATTQGGTFPAPTPAAIKALQMSPTKRDEFDALFGPGAAAKALGR